MIKKRVTIKPRREKCALKEVPHKQGGWHFVGAIARKAAPDCDKEERRDKITKDAIERKPYSALTDNLAIHGGGREKTKTRKKKKKRNRTRHWGVLDGGRGGVRLVVGEWLIYERDVEEVKT